jgi:hypothetical protein
MVSRLRRVRLQSNSMRSDESCGCCRAQRDATVLVFCLMRRASNRAHNLKAKPKLSSAWGQELIVMYLKAKPKLRTG